MRQDGSDQSEEMHRGIEQKYDIGSKRNLEQYANFCGIDIMHKKELFTWCQDYKWVPYTMTDEEIEEIRSFGNPHHLRGAISERSSIDYQFVYDKEEMLYRELVGEVDNFKHSSWIGKAMHIVVFIMFLICFVWCVYALVLKKSGTKFFSDIKQS